MVKMPKLSASETRKVWLLLVVPILVLAAGYCFLFPSRLLSSLHRPLSSYPRHNDGARFLLQVPQIAWGLNNQKIALARSLLTARFLNRSLLLPSLSSSLTYKDTARIEPLPFDHLFSLPKFNKLCEGFVAIDTPVPEILHGASGLNVSKGSGRRWTKERDLQQLLRLREHRHTLINISGKNPFLWHDHWPVSDYAKVFRCFVLVDKVYADVDRIVSALKQRSIHLQRGEGMPSEGRNSSEHDHGHGMLKPGGYVAVHMRIEKDWMIHCKKTEERVRLRQGKVFNICSSKQEIMDRVSHLSYLSRPSLVYLAVADVLLEDRTLLQGWQGGLVPYEKKSLGLLQIYKKYPYLIQSALDYEVCLRAEVFVGNSFSTFSSLIALERTMKVLETHSPDPCSGTSFPSFAYNIQNKDGGPQIWRTNLSDSSLQIISYGTNEALCDRSMLVVGL